MKVEQIEVGNALKNYTYVLYDTNDSISWVIDPYKADQVIEFLEDKNLNLQGVINTHSHFDHVKGNKKLLTKYGCSQIHDLKDQHIKLGGKSTLKSLFLPGHCADHVCYILEVNGEETSFFSGDLIFDHGIGNTRNGGNFNQLYESIQKAVSSVSPHLDFYPGHDYRSSNISFSKSFQSFEEKPWSPKFSYQLENNLFLRLNDTSLRKSICQSFGIDHFSAKEYLLFLRSKRDQW